MLQDQGTRARVIRPMPIRAAVPWQESLLAKEDKHNVKLAACVGKVLWLLLPSRP